MTSSGADSYNTGNRQQSTPDFVSNFVVTTCSIKVPTCVQDWLAQTYKIHEIKMNTLASCGRAIFRKGGKRDKYLLAGSSSSSR